MTDIRIPTTDDRREVDWWRETVSRRHITSSGGSGFKIGFLSDSSLERVNHSSFHWLILLKTNLESKRCFVDLIDSSVGGHTFYRTYTDLINGMTTLDYLISKQPDVIIIHLGHNDMFQGRTIQQLKGDVDIVINKIRTQLPKCYIVYASEHWYNTLKQPSQLLNIDISPHLMQLRTSGLFAGCRCATILGDPAPQFVKDAASRWLDFDAYVRTKVDKTCISPLWRGQRLGVTIEDLLHANSAGQTLLAMVMTEIIHELKHFPAISSLYLQDGVGDKFDLLFRSAYTQIGNNFYPNPTQDFRNFLDRCNMTIGNFYNWFRKYKTEPITYFPDPLYYSPNTILTFLVRNAEPNAPCFGSHSNYWIYMGTTNPSGNALVSYPITTMVPGPGQYDVNFKIGSEIYEVGTKVVVPVS